VPPQYWDEICPEPSDAVLDLVKKDKDDKMKSKQDGSAKAASNRTKGDTASQKKQVANEFCARKKVVKVATAAKGEEAKY
jgi:hypothetical protein